MRVGLRQAGPGPYVRPTWQSGHYRYCTVLYYAPFTHTGAEIMDVSSFISRDTSSQEMDGICENSRWASDLQGK